MTQDASQPAPFDVVIAVRELAAERVSIRLLAPGDTFHYRPLAVRAPFSAGAVHRYELAPIVADHGATLVKDSFAWVDPAARTLGTESGQKLRYDALLLALGARALPAFESVITIDDRVLEETFRGVVQDIELGYVKRVAFIVPSGPAWPLPLYELALMTAQRAFDMCIDVELSIVTPEDAPLAIFGQGASIAASALLEQAGVVVHASSYPSVVAGGTLRVYPGARPMTVDRIVSLPTLVGPAVRGLPAASEGFIPVNPYGQVAGVTGVYAAGDATDFAVKHGGVAAQQADVAATSIAALAGADVVPERFRPVIRGMLLTGREPRYMTAQITGGAGFSSTFSLQCPWSPPTKVVAKHLGPYLASVTQPPPGDHHALTGAESGGGGRLT